MLTPRKPQYYPTKGLVRSRARWGLNSAMNGNESLTAACVSDEYMNHREEMAARESMGRRMPSSPAEYNTDDRMDCLQGEHLQNFDTRCNDVPHTSYPDSRLTIQNQFRRQHGPYTRSTNMGSGPVSASAAYKIGLWQNRNFDSGVQTMAHSQVPSMISTMTSLHPASHLSGVSSMADEMARTELSDQQQQLRFEHIPSGSNPDYGKAVRAIPQLIALLKDDDKHVVLKAVGVVQNIAKMDAENKRKDPPVMGYEVLSEVLHVLRDVIIKWKSTPVIVRVTLGSLFHISNRAEALPSVVELVAENDWELLKVLIVFIGTEENACRKNAILTFHSVLSEKTRGFKAIMEARRLGALNTIGNFHMRENSEKLLPVIVDLIRLLCDKDSEQKKLFLEMGGISNLLSILNKYSYENLLWRTTQLLKAFANSSPKALVGCGAHATLGMQLGHESQRLVMSSLECLKFISDVPCEEEDCFPLFSSLLRLMGNRNPSMILCAVHILSNMCANNKAKKEFLVRNQAVPALVRQLTYDLMGPNQGTEEELHSAILNLLRSLCIGHELVNTVQVAVFECPEVFLHKLATMRPALIKHTLQVLQSTASNDCNLQKFAQTRLMPNNVTFVQQIVHILCVACSEKNMEETEGIRVDDLIQLCMAVLQHLCRHPILLQMVVEYLKHSYTSFKPLLPVFALQQCRQNEEAMKRSALGLINQLAHHPEMARMFAANEMLLTLLQQNSFSSHQAIATYANQAYQTITNTGSMGMDPPQRHQMADVIRSSNPNQYHSQIAGPSRSGGHSDAMRMHPHNSEYRMHNEYPVNPMPYNNTECMRPTQRSHQYYHEMSTPRNISTPNYETPHQASPVQGPSRAEPVYNTSGPSTMNTSIVDYDHEVSPLGNWPEDLNEVNNPFANMFCETSNVVATPPFSPSHQHPLVDGAMEAMIHHGAGPSDPYWMDTYSTPPNNVHMGADGHRTVHTTNYSPLQAMQEIQEHPRDRPHRNYYGYAGN